MHPTEHDARQAGGKGGTCTGCCGIARTPGNAPTITMATLSRKESWRPSAGAFNASPCTAIHGGQLFNGEDPPQDRHRLCSTSLASAEQRWHVSTDRTPLAPVPNAHEGMDHQLLEQLLIATHTGNRRGQGSWPSAWWSSCTPLRERITPQTCPAAWPRATTARLHRGCGPPQTASPDAPRARLTPS